MKEGGKPPNEETEEPVMVRRSKDKLRQDLKGTKHYQKHRHHHHHHQHKEAEPEPTGFEPSEEMIKKTKKQLKRDLHEARRKKRMENKEVVDEEGAVASTSDGGIKTVPEKTEVTPSTGSERGHGK